jgi:hypothetical protein
MQAAVGAVIPGGVRGLRPWVRAAGLAAGSLGALSACAVNPALDLAEISRAQAPILLEVPFHPQEENQCGPAALATVLAAAGVETTPDALSPGLLLPAREGSLQIEILGATRRARRIPYVLDASPQALVGELESGRPVLVLQNLRTRSFPAWHYAVLIGLDAARNEFRLNSGPSAGLAMSAPHFLRSWDWARRWALVALRPGELPADPDPARYLAAVADFEAVAGSAAAWPSWQAAAQRWPDHPGPALALGNAAHGRGDLAAAVRHFRAGLALRPGDPVLANNLASVLGEAGCPRAGEAVLRPVAAALDPHSEWRPALRATLAELAARGAATRIVAWIWGRSCSRVHVDDRARGGRLHFAQAWRPRVDPAVQLGAVVGRSSRYIRERPRAFHDGRHGAERARAARGKGHGGLVEPLDPLVRVRAQQGR